MLRWLILITLVSGCASTSDRINQPYIEAAATPFIQRFSVPEAIRTKLHQINPDHISRQDIASVLSHYPAPRIFGIGGGVYTAHILMEDLAEFLIGMGYPKNSVYHPTDGKFAISAYTHPEQISGEALYYYQQEGAKPILIGHSLGGVQSMKAAHFLSGNFGHKPIRLFNPFTKSYERQTVFRDPLSGKSFDFQSVRPIAHIIAVGSGGISRVFPSQWSMGDRVKQVPDSVISMTGIHLEGDWLGNDFLKGKEANEYRALGAADVRNIYLPPGHNHVTLIRTKHLLQHQEVKEWIDQYRSTSQRDRLAVTSPQLIPLGPGPADNILLAAQIWNILKREWYLSALEVDVAYEKNRAQHV